LKVVVVIGLALAGLAQWWLAKVLRLGIVPRLWSAGMVIVAGHIAGRLGNGLVEMMFSTASCSLVIPATLQLALTGSRRAAVAFGLTLGLALLSGQGYIQVGLLVSVVPAALILIVDRPLRLKPVWKEFVLGGGLALLIAGVYLVPFLHFFPHFAKWGDSGFANALQLDYIPFDLVIRDHSLYKDVQYADYISWVSVGLVVAAFRLAPRSRLRVLAFFSGAVALAYLGGSAWTFRALRAVLPSPLNDLASNLHFPSEISMLAVPLLLGVAAWGLDLLLKLTWPKLGLTWQSGRSLSFNMQWLVLGVPLVWAILSALDFGAGWLSTDKEPADWFRVMPEIKPVTTQWVEPPYADNGLAVSALENGFKLTRLVRPWWWKDRDNPPPTLKATRDQVDPATPGFRGKVEYLSLIDYPDVHYASVQIGTDQPTPCQAMAQGGNIDVVCQTDTRGQLLVYENYWSGWSVTRDGAPAMLEAGPWLSTAAPAGLHRYSFRYRPWDVWIGLSMTLAGIILTAVFWRRADPKPSV
jgi:hypothetical protein